MRKILVLYGSKDGQTARVARRIGDDLRHDGHTVTVLSADSPQAMRAIDEHDAVIVGGGIRYGHFPKFLEQLVLARAVALSDRPNAFFSVCLSGGGPGARPKTAASYVDQFRRRTAWHPHEVEIFGGALLYTRYNPFIRIMLRIIVGIAGGDTDTSRDYEYTDWKAVDGFADRFASELDHAQAA
jgi:menaquinone-dependent protoporphyrinogen oxidase